MKKGDNYKVRYGPPWRHGERSQRYYVVQTPRFIQNIYDLFDPIDREIKRFGLFLGIVFDMLVKLAMFLFGLYLFIGHVLPVIIKTFGRILS